MNQEILKNKNHVVAHHFGDASHEFDTCKLGMWAFLAQEILFFAGVFVAYAVFRYLYPDMFLEAHKHLSWQMGALNTLILITSSFTMVMGVRSVQLTQLKTAMTYLSTTLVLAGGFMVVKAFEYASKISHGLLPNVWFNATSAFETSPIFFGCYFFMTGLHGLHVVIGMGLILWIMLRLKKGEFRDGYFTPVEMVGLYWHLVDLIWIFLFPLLYLVG